MYAKRKFRRVLTACMAAFAMAPARADYSDCRTCHYAVTPESTAPDFSNYFGAPGHHPVHVIYPTRSDFNRATGLIADVLFFDRNGDGVPDPDEVQIYRSADGDAIECASCHMEHGTAPAQSGHPVDYVRNNGAGSVACLTCHNL